MQGKNTNIIIFIDALKAFKFNLENVEMHNYTMFEMLDIVFDGGPDGMPDHMKNGIMEHLLPLESEFERYFPETTNEDFDFVRNSSIYPIEKLADKCQNNFLELVNHSTTRQVYQKTSATSLDC